jgi:hypothetical protein
VPIEQNVNASPSPAGTGAASAIENEIPAYRAISPGAVFSLIFGILAVFCYAHPFFLLFAGTAVVLGILSDRKIQRLPDVLTGRGLAQAGIALGLVFGLTALTISTVQSVLLTREAGKFARQFEVVLAKGSYDDSLWYSQAPLARKDKTPAQLVAEMNKSTRDKPMFDMRYGQLKALKDSVAAPGAEVHFQRIERQWDDGSISHASALYEVHQPKPTPPAESVSHALAILKGTKSAGRYEWWVDEMHFPYRPDTYVAPAKPVDDGHGHGGGEHDGH